MPNDVPTEEKEQKRRGLFASRNEDPTLQSYLSSLLYVLSVPTLILVAFVGYWRGLYSYDAVIPVFGGLLLGLLIVTFGLMHVLTGR